MAAGISIPITSESGAFEAGVRSGVLDPLEDTFRALDKVEQAGDDAGSELERSFERAQDSTKELAREHRKLADTIRDEARKSNRVVRDSADDGFRGSSEAVRGFKDEAVQNFSEVASSFDGSVGGAVDGVQGLLGGLATSITGPVGLAFGGIGLIAGTVASNWAIAAEDIAADWQEMYDDMVESGETFLSQDLVNQRIQEIAQDQGKVNAAVEEGRSIGSNYLDVIRAQAGDMDALTSVLTNARGALEEQNAAQDDFIAKNGDESAAIADKQGQLELLVEKYERLIGAQDGAASAAAVAKQAMDESAASNQHAADTLDNVTAAAGRVPQTIPVQVRLDAEAFRREMDEIRRARYEVTAEVTWQHRGRTLE